MRHQAITNKELCNLIIEKLIDAGYTKISNPTIEEEDFIIIDPLFKQFAWFEAEHLPYPTNLGLFDDLSISSLIKLREPIDTDDANEEVDKSWYDRGGSYPM